MELRRHIDQWLKEWKDNPEHKPALIRGIRQSGKTYSVKRFARNNYASIIYLNFWDRPHAFLWTSSLFCIVLYVL